MFWVDEGWLIRVPFRAIRVLIKVPWRAGFGVYMEKLGSGPRI